MTQRRWFVALCVGVAAAALYLSTYQTRYYGDYVGLATPKQDWARNHQALAYGWLELATRAGLSFELALRLLSPLPAALACALWAATAPRERAWWSAAWLALTPVVWFFATTVEVHGLQVFGAVLGYRLAECAARAAGTRRWLLAASSVSAPLVFHPLLALQAPALLALALPRPTRWRVAAIASACAALVALPILALVAGPADHDLAGASNWARDLANGVRFAFRAQTLGIWPGPADFASEAWYQIAAPFGALCVFATPALVQRARRGEAYAPALIAFATHVLMLPLFGVREYGAYAIGLVPFLVDPVADECARTSSRATSRWAIAALAFPLAWHALLGHQRIGAYEAIGSDDEWFVGVAECIDASGAPRERANVLTLSDPRCALLQQRQRIRGTDFRFAADAVPLRMAPLMAERAARGIALEMSAGARVFIDRALLEPHLGLERARPFVEVLRARFRVIDVCISGPIVELRLPEGAAALESGASASQPVR